MSLNSSTNAAPGSSSGEASAMSDGGHTRRGRGKPRGKRNISRSERAGLQFSVGRVARKLKQGRYSDRLSADAPVYMAAVLEYITAEILDLAGEAARNQKKLRITPRHIRLALSCDEDFSKVSAHADISGGGVTPRVDFSLLYRK